MSKAWTNITAATIGAEKKVNVALLGSFHSNQEALISQPIDTRFAEFTGPATFDIEVYIPAAVATLEGDVTLVVRLEARVSAGGTTGQVRVKLGAGSFVTSSSFTSTSYAFFTLTISSADVKAVADTVAILQVETLRTAGSGDVLARCGSASSRLERAA